MGITEIKELDFLLPYFIKHKHIWSDYDAEVDTLYIHFKESNFADSSEMTDDDVIIRYQDGEVIGLTVLHASLRGYLLMATKTFLWNEVEFYQTRDNKILIQEKSGGQLLIDQNGQIIQGENNLLNDEEIIKAYKDQAEELFNGAKR